MNQVSGLYFRSTTNNEESKHFYLKDSEGLYPRYPDATTERLLITESVIDAATLLQVKAVTDYCYILAAYGTNRLTTEHVEAIKKLKRLREIIFAFDADAAGNEAAGKYSRQLQELLPRITISKINLPEGEDVNSLAVSHDASIFTHLLETRTVFFLSTEKTIESDPSQEPLKSEPEISQTTPMTPLIRAMLIRSSMQRARPLIMCWAACLDPWTI